MSILKKIVISIHSTSYEYFFGVSDDKIMKLISGTNNLIK